MQRMIGILGTLVLAAPAFAATPKVGQAAPELGSANWVMNQPEEESIQALKGEVIFVEKWGVQCPPCLALIPHVEHLQETYGERGLHIFAFEAQNHSADEIKSTISSRGGKSYPVSAGGGSGYQGDGTIPVAWLVGVDGTVIWQGNPSADQAKLDKLIEAEVAKVRYPGLGRTEFDPEVLDAVKSYMKKELGQARNQARDVLASDKSGEQAKQDAQYLVDKVDAVAKREWAKMEQDREAKRYLEAYELLKWFEGSFKHAEEGDQAKDLIKQFKRDKELKRELEAAIKLEKLLAQLDGQPDEVKTKALTKFAQSRKIEGTAAGQRAASMAQ